MIELHTAPTPNGFKASIALEEMALPYTVHPVDLRTGAQFHEDFLRISPNNKIPAIVDTDPASGARGGGAGATGAAGGTGGAGTTGGRVTVFESGAILLYLAEKTGKLLPAAGQARAATFAWMFFQAGGTGPMLGQLHHFKNYAQEKLPYAIDRYTNEGKRLYHVVDKRLSESRYLAGDEYTIADIMNLPWLLLSKGQGIEIDEYRHVKRGIDELKARPAVERGLAVPPRDERPMDEKAREHLFGKTQYTRR
ncbi:MAG TPA: glutathione binding-like protein [Polyangiaceae bacterium]